MSLSGTFAGVRDNRGWLHTVSVDARWTATGPVMTTVNGPGSKRKQRSATATATIVFDGNTLVDGFRPFVADSYGTLLIAIETVVPKPLSQVRADLPPGLEQVVLRAFARARTVRYPSMNDLIEALRPFGTGASQRP